MALTEYQMQDIGEIVTDPRLSIQETATELLAIASAREVANYLQHELELHGPMWKEEYAVRFRATIRELQQTHGG